MTAVTPSEQAAPVWMHMWSKDRMPHLANCLCRILAEGLYTALERGRAAWWGVSLGRGCIFNGTTIFRRYPGTSIAIHDGCRFNSRPTSNPIGVNRPCMMITLRRGATIVAGKNCGFSGTVLTSSVGIRLGDRVRCGANTTIIDTDFHTDDSRAGPDSPVAIGNDVWLGVGVIVLKGVTIGDRSVVGAGSVVTSPIPSGVLAAGNPARIIREL